jgi:hypothetical protein
VRQIHAACVLTIGFFATTQVNAAVYRIDAASAQVLPGDTIPVSVEVETETSDNLVGIGHFSFAIDLTVSGTSSAAGDALTNIIINESQWDDTFSNQIGSPAGDQLVGTGGVTTDVFEPNFGSAVGDTVELFTLNLNVPADAAQGETIILTPSEGFLENLTVNAVFDAVTPQNFAPFTFVVVPEPGSGLLAAMLLLIRRNRPSW